MRYLGQRLSSRSVAYGQILSGLLTLNYSSDSRKSDPLDIYLKPWPHLDGTLIRSLLVGVMDQC